MMKKPRPNHFCGSTVLQEADNPRFPRAQLTRALNELVIRRLLLQQSTSQPTPRRTPHRYIGIQYQLYSAFPETKVQTPILTTVKKDPLIFKRTIEHQFSALVVQPLRKHLSNNQSTQHHMPFVIVIDGLDECIGRASQKAILTGLVSSVQTLDPYIRILIASRPEHDIKLSLSSDHLKDMHSHLSLDLDDEKEAGTDIKLYLCGRLAQIKDGFHNCTCGRKLDTSWPGEEVIQGIVDNFSGQFINAATVIRYLVFTRHRPDHHLDVVLNLRPHNGYNPFAQLDALYAMIFESASDKKRFSAYSLFT
ncbi:hypothetical protein CPC08DRAFT_264587 [Agrocybe pediades]|nr:hypothetical protein CPC08DRAFT_264587 [Agrocybe pediades]